MRLKAFSRRRWFALGLPRRRFFCDSDNSVLTLSP
jgi:hypothetical protein